MISNAYAQGAAAAPAFDQTMIMMILMFVVIYFLIMRPQMKKAKEQKLMLAALQKGDEVVISGGTLGKLTKVTDAYVSVEIASNVEITVQRGAVTTLLPKGTLKSVAG